MADDEISEYELDKARRDYHRNFEPRIELAPVYTGDENGDVADTNDPTKIWIRTGKDRNTPKYRISAGNLSPGMPADLPILVGKTLGYSSPYPEAKAVFNDSISSPTGATYRPAWISGGNRAIAYADSAGNLKGNANIFSFFETNSQMLIQGGQSSLTMDTYNNSATVGSFFGAHVAEGTYNTSTGVASPSAITSGHLLMYFGVRVYGTSAFSTSYNARLKFTATENATNTAHGTKAVMEANLNGAAAGVEMQEWGDGGVNALYAVGTPIATVTTTTTLDITHSTVLVDATGGAVTINLPAVAGVAKRIYTVKKIDVSVNAVTIDASGTELIDGALTQVLALQYSAFTIQCDGAAWWITAKV